MRIVSIQTSSVDVPPLYLFTTILTHNTTAAHLAETAARTGCCTALIQVSVLWPIHDPHAGVTLPAVTAPVVVRLAAYTPVALRISLLA